MAFILPLASRSLPLACKVFQVSGPGIGCCQSKYVFKTISLNTSACKLSVRTTLRNFHSRILPNQVRNSSKPAKGFLTPRLLALVSPFTFFNRQAKEEALSKEILDSLPKAVFRSESRSARKKYFFIVEWILRLWINFRYLVRFVRLFVTFAPILFTYPVTYLGDGCKRRWWSLLMFACEISGPTFIKLGQWASTRRDLFEAEFCDLFSKLHYSTKIHAWHTTKYKLQKAFGRRWKEIFVSIEKKPIGSGCIAQVHRAWMRADKVADAGVLEEILAEYDDDDNDLVSDIEFAEGMEITGLAQILDFKEQFVEYLVKKMKKNPSESQKTPSQNPEASAENDGANDIADTAEMQTNTHLQEYTPTEMKEAADGEKLVPVAIKVAHPGVFKLVKRDLQIIENVSHVIEFLIPSVRWLSVSECCSEFTSLLTRQIDLRHEAKCLEVFVENFKEDPNVRFPRPIRPFCKRDVLVETFEEGQPISNFLQENAVVPDGLKELLAGYGVQALLQMVFVDNFVHGDLHPGNILVQNVDSYSPEDENKLVLIDMCETVMVNIKPAENPVRLVLVDAGITSSLSDHDLQNFKAVFTAVVVGEGEKVAELILRHARYNDCKDIANFKKELGHLVNTTRQQTVTLGQVRVAELLSGVFSIMSRHKVKLESNFASILLAIFVLEGLGRSLDPEMNILTKAKPILLAS